MTPAALTLARDGSTDATAATMALWAVIVDRVAVSYAGAALDLVAGLVGEDTDVPAATLREAVVRLGLYLRNTEVLLGRATLKTEDIEFAPLSEFHGGPLRKSGVHALLGPWVTPVVGVI